MAYTSKRIIASLAAGIGLCVAYLVFALGNAAPALDDLRAWAIAMLAFIGIGIVAVIAIQILFNVAHAIGIAAKEGDAAVERTLAAEMAEDERDKLIALKSTRVEALCIGIGFVTALVALALGWEAVLALHLLLGAFAVGAMAEGCMGVYLYERGV